MLFYVNALFVALGRAPLPMENRKRPRFPTGRALPNFTQSALCSNHLGSSFIIKNESTLFPRQAV